MMPTKQNRACLETTRRDLLRLLGVAGAASALPAMVKPAMAGAPDSIVLGMAAEPTMFNPLRFTKDVDRALFPLIYDPLWYPDEHGKPIPYLAREIPSAENGGLSADRLTWRVKLRDGIKWHDGQPFTAEDVKFSLELLMNPKFQAGVRTGHLLVRDITVISPTELTWRMERPFAPYMSILSRFWIVPKHVLADAADPNDVPFNNAPIGTGPYKWVRRQPGDHIEFTAFDDYYLGKPAIKTAIWKYVSDINVLYAQFVSGDVDYFGTLGIPADKFEAAKKIPGRKVLIAPTATIENLYMNYGKPQFQELAVRQALYHAIDKAAITDAIYNGVVKATESYVPRELEYFNKNLPKHEYNIDKANALLDKAGWKRGAGGVRAKNGVTLAFNLATASGDSLREQTQQVIQQSWNDIGVSITITNFPAAVVWGDYWSKSRFDMFLTGLNFIVGVDPDGSNYLLGTNIPVQGGNGANAAQYKNAEVDALFAQGAVSFDDAERRVIYNKAQLVLREDLAFLPIYQWARILGTKSTLKGVRPSVSVLDNDWNVYDWKWS